MAKEQGTTIWVSLATRERMRQEITRIVSAVEAGQREDPGIALEVINPRCQGLTFDQLINLLLDSRQAHQRRARKQRKKKRGELHQGEEQEQ